MLHRRLILLTAFVATFAIFLLTQFSTPRASALSNPCAQDPNNLTSNGSMFGPGHATSFGIVADGWNPFVLSSLVPTFEWVNNEKSPGDPGGSQYLWADLDATSTFDAGIYQTISGLTPGNYYHFGWGYSLAAYDPGNQVNTRGNLIGRQVGVDATGGTSASAPTVNWGNIYWDGIAALNIPTLNMTFTAQTTNATIFLRAIAMQPSARDKVWFDSICMERVTTPPTNARVFLPIVASNTGVTQTICTTTNVATVTVGATPKGVAADPASNRVYVGLFNDSSVAVIDTTTNQKIATFSTNTQGHSNGVGVTNGRLIVSLRDASAVAILDAVNGTVIATRTVGALPYGVGAANGRAWVANFSSNSVSVIDATTTNVISTTSVGDSPSLVASVNDRAYVSYWGGGVVSIRNDGVILADITQLGGATFGVAVNLSANRLYATRRDVYNSTNIVNLNTNLVINSVTEPVEPIAIAVNPATNHLFIVLPSINTVRVRDATTLAFIKDLSIGVQGNDGGDGIVVANSQVYVSNNSAGTVSVIQDVCQ